MPGRMTVGRCHIFFHSGDLDGRCAGAIAQNYMHHDKKLKCFMRPFDFGQEPDIRNIPKGDPVIVLDLGLPVDTMTLLKEKAGENLFWIDHHKTTVELHKKLCPGQGTHQLDRSACEITWDFFHFPHVVMPLPVFLLGRYDVWDETSPFWKELILPYQYGFRTHGEKTIPRDTDESMAFWATPLLTIATVQHITPDIQKGAGILLYMRAEASEYCEKFGRLLDFEGHRALVVNRGRLNMLFFDAVWDADKHDICIAYARNAEGLQVVNIYTRKDHIDCTELVKKFGGGGHQKAAGFTSKDLPF